MVERSLGEGEAIELLRGLVSIPSPSREEQAASEFLVAWMNEHGFAAHVDEAGNAVGCRGDGPREILLLGHIDTFPGEVPVREEGGKLYGRGSVDAKGPLCTFVAAARDLFVPPSVRITVVGAVEEEAATSKGARHVLASRREEGARPVACVIGEPSRWDRVTLGYKGRLLLNVELRLPFAHSAGPEKLPAERGVELWTAIERACEEWNEQRETKGEFDRLTPSLRSFRTEDDGAFGVVKLGLGFRLPTAIAPEELESRLRDRIGQFEFEEVELEFTGGERAYRGGKANPLVRSFLRAIRAEGGEPRFVVKTGTADMNVVGPHWEGTPIVAYGPGDSSLDHTPDEHVEIEEFLRAQRVLRGTLAGLVGGLD